MSLQTPSDPVFDRERWLPSLVENLFDGVLVLDADGIIRYANPAAARMAGRTTDDMIGRRASDFLPEADGRTSMDQLRARMAGEIEPGYLQAPVIRPDGSSRILEFVANPLPADGPVTAMVVNCRDITRQKEADRQLEESEARFRSLIYHTPQLVYRIDTGGRLFDLNPTAAEALGGPLEPGRDLHFNDVVHPEDHEEAARVFGRALEGHASWYELRVVSLRGETIHIRGVSVPLRVDGEIVEIAGVAEDVTAMLESRRALAEAEQRVRHVLSVTPIVLYSVQLHGREIAAMWVSENIREIFGYEPESITSEAAWMEHVHPDDVQKVRSAQERLWTRDSVDVEYRIQRGDGEYIWIQDSPRVIRSPEGRALEVLGSWTDITAGREIEEQLRESQKMEAIGRLTGGVAHDFNNLLTAIRGYTELLLQSEERSDQDRADLEEVRKAADQAARLTQQLLAFSRRQMLQPEELDLNAVVSEMSAMLERVVGEDVHLITSLESDLPRVEVDRTRLEQVIVNLSVNARDAMPGGGELRIETRQVEGAGDDDGACVRVSVRDTGSGIPEEVRPHLFEPFFTTKPQGKGTGLGLSTVLGIVEQSGGRIEYETEADRGTSFHVLLPAIDTTAG